MAMNPAIYATKYFPKGSENETHDAFSFNRSLVEQEDLLGVAHLVVSNFLNEPHTVSDTKRVQEALRGDENELVKLASFIGTIPDPKARDALTKRYDRLQRTLTDMDLRLGLDRMAAPQGEAKNTTSKLLFLAGFPAAVATAMKVITERTEILAICTVGAFVVAASVLCRSNSKSASKLCVINMNANEERKAWFLYPFSLFKKSYHVIKAKRERQVNKNKDRGNTPN